MKESQLQTLFKKHLESETSLHYTSVYELKLVKTKSLAFDKIPDHQVEGLWSAKHNYIFHKLTDMPHFAGAKYRFDMKKPFDCFTIAHSDAYLGVCFYEPRKPKELILIDIDNFIDHKNATTKKSMNEETAKYISSFIIQLKNNYGSKKDS